MPSLHIFGIRHHGPGSARSVKRALETLQPDIVLVEGPPDAESVLPLLAHAAMKPPVALLVYAPDAPQYAAYYPFAEYSPEWQAVHYALSHKVPARFMDLPLAHQFTIEPPQEAKQSDISESENDSASPSLSTQESENALSEEETPLINARRDPLRWLAHAAGYEDSERWWEDMVEHRADSSEVFEAVLEAMTALRLEVEKVEAENSQGEAGALSTQESEEHAKREAQREAWMRQTIRAAAKEGFRNIAVICGAWHAPALQNTLQEKPAENKSALENEPASAALYFSAQDDAALLKNLPKTKTLSTWVPWTNGRLCFAGGYGAGIESPGWYGHLWHSRENVVTRWMARVASMMREEDMDISSAHIIEAVRLAETLATLRGRPLAGLPEINDAIQSVLFFGSNVPMKLIHKKLIVGETLGEVPEETPSVPLQQDVSRQQKTLRLLPDASLKSLDFDLRKPNDLQRSHLLHRLNLLGIGWGKARDKHNAKGTFHELWDIQWHPEFAIQLIEASRWGSTLIEASTHKVHDIADSAADLPTLTNLLDKVLLADLPDATSRVMRRVQEKASLASDIHHMIGALPAMVNVVRYGNVRGTDNAALNHIVDGLVARICIGLPLACSSLNDEAAAAMRDNIARMNHTVKLLQNPEHLRAWQSVLGEMSDKNTLHGLLAGQCCRLLLDADVFDMDETARRMGLALSAASEPAQAAAWIEGFLRDSAAFLLHDEDLWSVLNRWVATLSPDHFQELLPLLRRTFSTFTAPERRQLGERVARRAVPLPSTTRVLSNEEDFDGERAAQALPLMAQLLGLGGALKNEATA